MSRIGECRTVWRVTIETLSCFTIGTGGGDDLRDALCVTDANGLPALPATSITGVLRSAVTARSLELANRLFGVVEGENGQASRLEVSWGQVHDQQDKIVRLRRPGDAGDALAGDPVLALLFAGVTRDHVSVGPNGVVEGRKKFDETLVPVGARFTFELQLVDPTDEEESLIVGALASHRFRLGGRTRMGHGRIKLLRLHGRRFDLRRPTEREAWLALSPRLEDKHRLHEWPRPSPRTEAPDITTIELRLEPEDYWLVGGGEPLERFVVQRGKDSKDRRAPDIVPLTHRVIRWANDAASVGEEQGAELLLPATSVKGAIRHRFLFLARCRALESTSVDPSRLDAALFGTIKSSAHDSMADDGTPSADIEGGSEGARDVGTPGCVFFEDTSVALAPEGDGLLDHVCLDRFSGAPMMGMLFNEAPRYRTKTLSVLVHVDDAALKGRLGADEAKLAIEIFRETLDDLLEGRLALGGGSNRGHGYFRGTRRDVAGTGREGRT